MASIARGRSRRREGDGSSERNAARSTVPSSDHQGTRVPTFLLQILMMLLDFSYEISDSFLRKLFFFSVRSPCDEDPIFDLGY